MLRVKNRPFIHVHIKIRGRKSSGWNFFILDFSHYQPSMTLNVPLKRLFKDLIPKNEEVVRFRDQPTQAAACACREDRDDCAPAIW